FPRPPWTSMAQGLVLDALQQDIARPVRPALLAVIGAVLLVLTMACVNVTNLLLWRTAQREGEFAVRGALGAGRGSLTRQLLSESVVLALGGGALGLAVAAASVGVIQALAPAGLPRAAAIAVNGSAFGFAVAVSV